MQWRDYHGTSAPICPSNIVTFANLAETENDVDDLSGQHFAVGKLAIARQDIEPVE
ncbi:hypothetical protein GCM10027169_17410 [Gordonia jinhuaensis]|uniref:Uncharacterized protein n=1 Tax=Gordonia jinhuaensis TaxID=1517702 RepID=A0A916TIT7_9ACTN|nr:hypothetical protein GCM10011489_38280 [Gordonia jinhuaensis]